MKGAITKYPKTLRCFSGGSIHWTIAGTGSKSISGPGQVGQQQWAFAGSSFQSRKTQTFIGAQQNETSSRSINARKGLPLLDCAFVTDELRVCFRKLDE